MSNDQIVGVKELADADTVMKGSKILKIQRDLAGEVEQITRIDEKGQRVIIQIEKDGCGEVRSLSDAVRQEWRERSKRPYPEYAYIWKTLDQMKKDLYESDRMLVAEMFVRNRVAMFKGTRSTIPPVQFKKPKTSKSAWSRAFGR